MKGSEEKVTPNQLCGWLVENANGCQTWLGKSALGLGKPTGTGHCYVYFPPDNPFGIGRGKCLKLLTLASETSGGEVGITHNKERVKFYPVFHLCLRFQLPQVTGEVIPKYGTVLGAVKAMLFKIIATGLCEMWPDQNERRHMCKIHNIF